MTDKERWISKLNNQIIDEDDKVLFNEATGCFLNNYYRASYILSWISIIESLKRKVKLFSNLGDSRAKDAYNEIEKTENNKQSTDKLIFEESKKCGIIDDADLSTIKFLWEQRCLFAHPYKKQPDEDEVKYIIHQSIKLVLAKELLYNKSFLKELSDNIVNKPFFLPTESERVREFAKRTIARTPEKLHPFLFKTLLFKVGEIVFDQNKFSEFKKLRYYLIELFINTQFPLDNSNWSLEDRVTKFPYECFCGFVHQETWVKLPDRIKEMLIDYLIFETDSNKLYSLKTIGHNLVKNNILNGVFKTKFFDKLSGIRFDSAINFYGEDNAKYKRIKVELKSGQYDQQNPVIVFLKKEKTLDFLNSLNDENQFYLGRLLIMCAINGHWNTQNFISAIENEAYKIPDRLKAGISYGSFISIDDKFDLDKKGLEQSLKFLNVIPKDIQNYVYNNLIDFLEKNSLDEWIIYEIAIPSFEELTSKILTNITDWDKNNKENFNRLLDKLNKIVEDSNFELPSK